MHKSRVMITHKSIYQVSLQVHQTQGKYPRPAQGSLVGPAAALHLLRMMSSASPWYSGKSTEWLTTLETIAYKIWDKANLWWGDFSQQNASISLYQNIKILFYSDSSNNIET